MIEVDWRLPSRVAEKMHKMEIERKNEETKSIPIVMFTALTQIDHMNAAEKAGASGYLVKPFKSKDLIFEVKKHIQE